MAAASANISDIFKNESLILHDLYRSTEKNVISSYKIAAIIVGILAVLCNSIVVVSSGLILKTGQQPRNTYILLGNVSLADTVVGICLIYFGLGDPPLTLSVMCMFKTGALVCSAIVSIFSVALIAVDRYCYIVHGLYYYRYFTTTRIRISIVVIWIIGLTLGFLPAVGWVNENIDKSYTCTYITLFPETLILFNTFLSVIILMLIALLYAIILMNALRNVKNIMATRIKNNENVDLEADENVTSVIIKKGYINDRNTNVLDQANEDHSSVLKRSASFSSSRDNLNAKRKSINELITEVHYKQRMSVNEATTQIGESSTSETELGCVSSNLSSSKQNGSRKQRFQNVCKSIQENIKIKNREPSKLRAVIIVSLTSGSLIITWLPFFVSVILYVLCENKQSNFQCFRYQLLLGPFLTLAFLNSLLNPLIYAWWHKGFKRSIKYYYLRHICNRNNQTMYHSPT